MRALTITSPFPAISASSTAASTDGFTFVGMTQMMCATSVPSTSRCRGAFSRCKSVVLNSLLESTVKSPWLMTQAGSITVTIVSASRFFMHGVLRIT
jgi:hypothetical protein